MAQAWTLAPSEGHYQGDILKAPFIFFLNYSEISIDKKSKGNPLLNTLKKNKTISFISLKDISPRFNI